MTNGRGHTEAQYLLAGEEFPWYGHREFFVKEGGRSRGPANQASILLYKRVHRKLSSISVYCFRKTGISLS